MSRYTIQDAVVVLDENSDVVDWFDTLEDAEAYIEELEEMEEEWKCIKMEWPYMCFRKGQCAELMNAKGIR